MDFNISNSSVAEKIDSCLDEFNKIRHIIEGMGSMSHPVPYLTRYSIIRACGTIEYGFKTIISDLNSDGQTSQIKNFIDKKFRNSSMNPSYSNIINSLRGFDDEWPTKFKEEMNDLENHTRIRSSLDSLNQARNAFAHGGSPSTSFTNVERYFYDSIKVLETIEKTISSQINENEETTDED